jgi:uncharacterized protein (TIGR03435 family)
MFMRSAIAGFFFLVQAGAAQTNFEVASVKLSAPGQNRGNLFQGGPGTPDPGRFTVTNGVLMTVLSRAFGVQFDQLSAPDWVGAVRIDIAATVPAGTTKDQLNLMLQNLLTERFHMTYHTGKREFPVYNLTVGKNGPKLKASAGEPAGPGVRINASCQGDHMLANGRDAAGVAQALQSAVGARVVDQTGLTGRYDFDLYFGVDRSGRTTVMNCKDIPLDAPGVFEAVDKQLGLKLEKNSAMLDLVVIDQLDKAPTDN